MRNRKNKATEEMEEMVMEEMVMEEMVMEEMAMEEMVIPFTEKDVLSFVDAISTVGQKSVAGPRARVSVLFPLFVACDAPIVSTIGVAMGGRNGLTKPIAGKDGNSFLTVPDAETIQGTIDAVDAWIASDADTRKRISGKEWAVARTHALLRAGFPTRLLVQTVVKFGHTRQGRCGGDEPTSPRTVAESGLYQTAE